MADKHPSEGATASNVSEEGAVSLLELATLALNLQSEGSSATNVSEEGPDSLMELATLALNSQSEGSPATNVSEEAVSDSLLKLNILTLDSQSRTLQVEYNIPVSLLKERILNVTGVPVDHQRVIFRGRVLMDDHLLSDYHVENGHTLHLVARQPSSDTSSGEDETTDEEEEFYEEEEEYDEDGLPTQEEILEMIRHNLRVLTIALAPNHVGSQLGIDRSVCLGVLMQQTGVRLQELGHMMINMHQNEEFPFDAESQVDAVQGGEASNNAEPDLDAATHGADHDVEFDDQDDPGVDSE